MGQLDSWPWLGVGWGRRGEAAVSAEVGILGLVCIGPAASASSSLLHQAVQILAPILALIMLFSPKPTPHSGLRLSQEPRPPPRSCACHSGTQLFHPASPFPPTSHLQLGLCVCSLLFTSLSISLSFLPSLPLPFSPELLPLSGSTSPLIPALLGHSSFLPPLSAWPFLQGSLHLAHLSPPSSHRVSGASQDALAPAPALSLLSPLLSWKVQSSSGWLCGRGSGCVL